MNIFRFYQKLKRFIRPHLGLLIASAALALPLSALRVTPAPLVKYVVDQLLIDKDHKKLLLFPVLVIVIYVLSFILRFAHYFLLRLAVVRINQSVRTSLFNHISGLSIDHFSSQRAGELLSRTAYDPKLIEGGLQSLTPLVREPGTFFILLGYALYLDWRLTVVTFLIFPLLAWVFTVSGKATKRYSVRMSEQNSDLLSITQEGFSGARIVTLFRLEKYIRKRFREALRRFSRSEVKLAAVEEAAHPMVELVTAFAIAAVIYYGGARVIAGEISSGSLLAFFAAFALMMDPIRKMNEFNLKVNTAVAGADRILETLNWKSRIQEGESSKRIQEFRNEIHFDHVSFSYPDDPSRLILNNVSFTVKKGSLTALVGQSGSGKSSLVTLLPRLYDTTEGKIRIDGTPIQEYRIADLRSLVSVVTQDVFLFNDTIEANIRCGRFSATDADVREAAARAHAADFIDRLPGAMKSIVGDRGQKLSGGERQRISIARAFLRNSPILILDEATSSLDTASEKHVQAALDDLMKARTTIVIAHRLSTIRHADEILVLKDGQIIERGTHGALLLQAGEYAHLNHQGQA